MLPPADSRLLRAVLIATIFVAGCSNEHSGGTPGTQGPAGAPAASASSGDTSDAVSDVQPCEKLTVSDLQPFFNTPIKKEVIPHGGCNFETLDGIQGIQVSTDSSGYMAKAYSDPSKPPTDDGKPGIALTGIGDIAIRESKDIWIYAVEGNMSCMIHGDHSGENAQGSIEEIRGLTLKDSLAGTIPAATAQAVAQNLGTLCNKMWGSGNTVPSFADLH